MTKATLEMNAAKTPSDDLIARAMAEVTITDARGRTIKLKKPGVLAQFRLVEALGETAKNQVYTAMVLPLIYVSEIDGDAVFQPTSKREIEALIQRLEDDGIEAISAAVMENFGKSNSDADKAALKN
jgi:hypothetical protein